MDDVVIMVCTITTVVTTVVVTAAIVVQTKAVDALQQFDNSSTKAVALHIKHELDNLNFWQQPGGILLHCVHNLQTHRGLPPGTGTWFHESSVDCPQTPTCP